MLKWLYILQESIFSITVLRNKCSNYIKWIAVRFSTNIWQKFKNLHEVQYFIRSKDSNIFKCLALLNKDIS